MSGSLVERFPRPDDLDRYHAEPGVPREAIVRDVARIVALVHLVHDGFLNDDCVLVGGMGLRLRGSSRFSMKDTDTSMRGELNEIELRGKLQIQEEALDIRPDDGTNWDRRKKLTIAQPIEYDAFFADVGGGPVTDKFTFTVNMRGLVEPADRLALIHPYPELVIVDTLVPVMNLTEQAAEKVVGWCAHGLMKHYVDLGYIGDAHEEHIQRDRFMPLVLTKVEVGKQIHGSQYDGLDNPKTILRALYSPDRWDAPISTPGNDAAKDVLFMGTKMPKHHAINLVRTKIIPALFTR